MLLANTGSEATATFHASDMDSGDYVDTFMCMVTPEIPSTIHNNIITYVFLFMCRMVSTSLFVQEMLKLWK